MVALQLIGSPTSDFYFNLSLLYAKEVVTPAGFELLFAVVYPDGSWSVSTSIEQTSVRVSLLEMSELVKHASLVVPHIFCTKGLTDLRIFFEKVLQLPMVGASGYVLKLAQDKQLTKLICANAGVGVPRGKVFSTTADEPEIEASLKYPLILKPNRADNSDGLSLVHNKDEFKEGLKKGSSFDDQVIVEEYIPGREIRGAVIEVKGKFEVLPFIEYQVNAKSPIRFAEDKLKFDGNGNLVGQSDKLKIPADCPAILSDNLKENLSTLMIKSHKALGCRDFSMFDFRIHKQTGNPYLLEAGLFWSFSPKSMISSMLAAENKDLIEVTGQLWRQAAARKNKA